MPTIVPNLWFDGDAESAAAFYTSIFPGSRIDALVRAPADNPSTAAGEILLVRFTLDGQPFVGINGGPAFRFTEAVSFQIDCADQGEVDRFWDALVAGGAEHGPCGWLKDRYGLSWQIVPENMAELLSRNPDKTTPVMLEMKKIIIEDLVRAGA